MFRIVLICFVMFSFSIDAMNSICNQKALNRKARNYVEIVSEGRTVDKESLVKSLQFLSEDALKDPMIAILANEAIFSNICKQASAVSNLNNFIETCQTVFTEGNSLKKAQISMLLEAVLYSIPHSETSLVDGGLEKLISSSTHYLLEPVD